jgi:hypothetical protein
LIRKNTFYCRYGVFKVRVDRTSTRRPPRGGSLKTQQRERARGPCVEVDVVPGEPVVRTAEGHRRFRRLAE